VSFFSRVCPNLLLSFFVFLRFFVFFLEGDYFIYGAGVGKRFLFTPLWRGLS